jgi:hypothetical protein
MENILAERVMRTLKEGPEHNTFVYKLSGLTEIAIALSPVPCDDAVLSSDKLNSNMSSQTFTPGQLQQDRQTAHRCQASRGGLVKKRMEAGWQAACKAAELLRGKCITRRLVGLGSLLSESRLPPWPDVDIAVRGLSAEHTFRAIGDVIGLDCSIEINLVDVNTCSPSLLKSIEREGVEL